jgi:tRNA A-37 threonylcarbamoyl transferase component Bud32
VLGRSASRVLAAIAVAGAVAITVRGTRVGAPGFDTAAIQRALQGRLRETAAALHARVATLAELPRLAAAVSTDAQTVRDLSQDELAFRPRRGEAIAIGQLPKNGPPVILLAFPDQNRAPPLSPIGSLVRIVAGHLMMSEAVKVVPRERAEELDGVVATSMDVDVDDFSRSLAAAGIAGGIVVGDQRLDIGAEQPGAGDRVIDLPLDGENGARLHLVLSTPRGGSPRPYWLGALGLTLLALFFSIRSRKSSIPVDASPRKTASFETDVAASQTPPSSTPASVVSPAPLPSRPSPRSLASRPSPASVVSPAAPISPTLAMPSAPPAPTGDWKIGRYEIVQGLGSGGMAEVYLARSTGEAGFSKKIALKVLQPAFARQPLVVEHFLDEARLASQLDHPNIVQIIDLGRASDEYFIAMEYVDGADLARLIDISHRHGRPVPLNVVLAILRKICDGLHAAHTTRAADGAALGLVHRDMKCGNVFVARNGVVKIGDFGIAKASHASRISRTEIGMVKGTPGYMAPEQRLAQPLDGRADLYGVGAIAYELLAGVPVNLDFVVLAQKGTEGWPHLAPLSQFRSDVTPELEAVVFRALAYDVADRFSDCSELELALEELARKHPPIAGDKTIAQWIEATLGAESASGTSGPSSLSRVQDI